MGWLRHSGCCLFHLSDSLARRMLAQGAPQDRRAVRGEEVPGGARGLRGQRRRGPRMGGGLGLFGSRALADARPSGIGR